MTLAADDVVRIIVVFLQLALRLDVAHRRVGAVRVAEGRREAITRLQRAQRHRALERFKAASRAKLVERAGESVVWAESI